MISSTTSLVVALTGLSIYNKKSTIVLGGSNQTDLAYRSPFRSISPSAYITGIVLIVLTLVLLCLFFVVFFHYRLVRVLPQEPSIARMGTSQSSSHFKKPLAVRQQRANQEPIELSQIHAISGSKIMDSTQERQPDASSLPVFTSLSTPLSMGEYMDSISMYTPIDNLSELESIQVDETDRRVVDETNPAQSSLELDYLLNSFKKEKSKSCENFVLIQNKSDDPILILNVMKVDNVEKSYL